MMVLSMRRSTGFPSSLAVVGRAPFISDRLGFLGAPELQMWQSSCGLLPFPAARIHLPGVHAGRVLVCTCQIFA